MKNTIMLLCMIFGFSLLVALGLWQCEKDMKKTAQYIESNGLKSVVGQIWNGTTENHPRHGGK